MILFSCPECGKNLKVKDELAGRKAKCPSCGKAVPIAATIPSQAGTMPPTRAGEAKAHPPTEGERPRRADPSEAPTLMPGGRPSPEASPVNDTQGEGPGPVAPEWTDFLAPPQGPGELGRLGPYRVLKVLGAGGMGVVYQAEDPQLKRQLALKVMLPSLGASESARKRFLREAQAAASIDHDHIVHIYQVGEDRGVPYMAMQFLHGQPLDERLKAGQELTFSEVLRIGRETAKGLAAAHKRGLIHRDIKPANLWLEGDDGRVKILDFGLARAVADDTHLTQQGAIVGTPAFMAPEQACGKPVDHRCDLFSLGCVLYLLCTGELPFKGDDTLAILTALALETPRAPRELRPQMPAALSDLIMELLAKDASQRPPNAQTVVETLAAIESTRTGVTPAPGPGKAGTGRAKKQAGSLGRKLVLVVAGLVLAIAAGIVLFRQTPQDPPPQSPSYFALEFSGKGDYVDIPSLSYAAPQPVTMEAWVIARRADATAYVLSLHGETTLSILQFATTRAWASNRMRGKQQEYVRGADVAPGLPVHLAAVWDGSRQHFFIAGRRVGNVDVGPAVPAFTKGALLAARRMLGGAAPDLCFSGRIDGVRISKVARYDKDFTPAKRFERDADTLALYHFDEGQGDVLKDSSGNGHHGKIVGAKWVKPDGPPPPPMAGFSLAFDGKSSRVTIPSFKYRGNHPLTLEAWAVLDRPTTDGTREVLMGDPERAGICINSGPRRWQFFGWFGGYVHAREKRPVPRQRLVHLAGVYDGKSEIRFYVDGELQSRTPIKKKYRGSPMPFTLGANPDAGQRHSDYFLGRIAEVRISKVAHYDKDFTPQKRFEPDEDAIGLYHFDEGQGDVLTDSSGNGYHGKIVGAKWVRADGTTLSDAGADSGKHR